MWGAGHSLDALAARNERSRPQSVKVGVLVLVVRLYVFIELNGCQFVTELNRIELD